MRLSFKMGHSVYYYALTAALAQRKRNTIYIYIYIICNNSFHCACMTLATHSQLINEQINPCFVLIKKLVKM